MGYYIGGPHDLILDGYAVIGFHGRAGKVQLLTADQARQLLGYSHLRHIYWLLERGHLPYRKFGRELVLTQQDIDSFRLKRGY